MNEQKRTENDKLKSTIDYLSEDQSKYLRAMLNVFCLSNINKLDVLNLATNSDTNKIDTAIPLDYQRSIENILPSFASRFNVFDYRTNGCGEMLNVAELFVTKLNEILSK